MKEPLADRRTRAGGLALPQNPSLPSRLPTPPADDRLGYVCERSLEVRRHPLDDLLIVVVLAKSDEMLGPDAIGRLPHRERESKRCSLGFTKKVRCLELPDGRDTLTVIQADASR